MTPPQRLRLFFDTTEAIRRAVRVRAAHRGVEIGDLLNEVLRREFAPEIAEILKDFPDADQEPETPPEKPKRGRKPKPPADPE